MNLVIDAGNTRIKVAYFHEGQLDSLEEVPDLLQVCNIARKKRFEKVIVSSVTRSYDEFRPFLTHTPVIYLDSATNIPIQSLYLTPSTLGSDRLAGVTAAHHLFPGRNCLVIDAGTCVTYDFIDHSGLYHGGSISPGVRMRLKAMNAFTAKLPLPETDIEFETPGKDTIQSLLSGAIFGAVCEAEGFIRYYRESYPDLQVILTGGDIPFFESRIKESIFVAPLLVLEGLNRILEFNEV